MDSGYKEANRHPAGSFHRVSVSREFKQGPLPIEFTVVSECPFHGQDFGWSIDDIGLNRYRGIARNDSGTGYDGGRWCQTNWSDTDDNC